MPTTRAVIIKEDTQIVDNITLVGGSLPDLPSGFRYIREADWVVGQEPKIGDHWEGDLPATFTTPAPVEEGDLANLTPAELLALQEAKSVEMNAITAELQRQLGG